VYVVLRVTGSGLENLSVCQPVLVSLAKVPVRSSSPVDDQIAPRWLPVLPVPL
jgi:hypothetical protein